MRALGQIVLWLMSLGALAAAGLLGFGTWIARSQPAAMAGVAVAAVAALVFAAVVNPVVSRGVPGMGKAGPRWIAAALMILVGAAALAFSMMQAGRLAQQNIDAAMADGRWFGHQLHMTVNGGQHAYGNDSGVTADLRIEATDYSGGPLARPMTQAEINELVLEPEKPRTVSFQIAYSDLDMAPFIARFHFDGAIGVISPPAGLAGWDHVNGLMEKPYLVLETDAGETRTLPGCNGSYAGKAVRYSLENERMEAVASETAVEQRLGVAPAYLEIAVDGCGADGLPIVPPACCDGDTSAYDAYAARHEAALKDFIAFIDGHVVTASLHDRNGRFLVKATFDAREISQAEAWARQEAPNNASPRP